MAISIKKYIDIVSGVGGAAQAARRELIGRLFSVNELIPTKSFIEFTDLESVGSHFGIDSEEYKRASFNFKYVSKTIVSIKKISFARWADADTAPQIFGEPADQLLGNWTPITDGSITITLGADEEVFTGLDFSLDASLADVATTIEVAIQGAPPATALWTGATVTYDAVRKSFDLNGGATGNAVVSVALGGSGTEIASMLGWLNTGTILSDGVIAETVTDTVTESAGASDNFGSFLFQPTLTLDQHVELAQWSKAENVKYQYYLSIDLADSTSYYNSLKNIGSVGVTIKAAGTVDEYPEMMPMLLMASTDYDRKNSNKNYMYQSFEISSSVDDTTTSNNLDALSMNYYGNTQKSGSILSFYQQGDLMGLASDPIPMNVFANEQWLKDAITTEIANLLLAVEAIPANADGEDQILGVIEPILGEGKGGAKYNGVISVGKSLSSVQKAFISQTTGDEDAWRLIESFGYWINVSIVEDTQNPGEFKAVYLLIYAKGDTVRKVEGTDILI